jgi:hypothetical protein
MTMHVVKCWPTSFRALKRGDKKFEIRKDDRGYNVGDSLFLKEYDPVSDTFSGDTLTKEITYILKPTPDEFFGLKMGYVILSVS